MSANLELDDINTLLADMLDALSDAHADAVSIMGPSVRSDNGEREVLAAFSHSRSTLIPFASELLAQSNDFLAWDGPLVAWQQLTTSMEADGWRKEFSDSGLVSFVRVAIELSGNRFFEIYIFTETIISNRADAATLAWAIMGNWPRIRRALAAQRLKLSPRELECLWYVCGGYTAREIGSKMLITERTATFFINSLSLKFGIKGKNALPQRASWLGLFDLPR